MSRNTTLQNRSKSDRLSKEHVLPTHHADSHEVLRFLGSLDRIEGSKEQILFSIGVEQLAGISNPAIENFLLEYPFEKISIEGVPRDAFDLLGSAYQYLNSKSENLFRGSFYTGREIANDLLTGLDFSDGQTLLDPSCGSGVFLFRSQAESHQIVGVDSDPNAIMIAKFNYFLKFPNAGPPALFCQDFFAWFAENNEKRFSYVLANPPYGANLDLALVPPSQVESGESFSLFFDFSHRLLADDGLLRFLVPEALLNVKRHTDIRRLLLSEINMTRIRRYSSKFAGVMSDVFLIEADKALSDNVLFESGDYPTDIPKNVFRSMLNQIFVHLDRTDLEILAKVKERAPLSLGQSTFGLGVVTGDNRSKILDSHSPGAEAVYTGKEVEKYRLLPPRKFLRFIREELQQVAPDWIYRSSKKLVYKTISKKLKFALDETGALTTNSANILIPLIPGYSTETVLGFLNSDLYSYLHYKLTGGVNKVGKEGLQSLPFPVIAEEQDQEIRALVLDVLAGGSAASVDEYIEEKVFSFSAEEVEHLRAVASSL